VDKPGQVRLAMPNSYLKPRLVLVLVLVLVAVGMGWEGAERQSGWSGETVLSPRAAKYDC
jgi:hypothetical protein